ncbi:MAG: hypothetical protein HZC28_14465 [Spirochaetes bacterium]|nr:hypothetical protein [Spirochaetota bacterium]
MKEKETTGKIYCANCRYCVLFRKLTSDKTRYTLRVKCTQEMWKKKLGEDKMYKYFTVGRRTVKKCAPYKQMGDLKSFLRLLRKSLPVRDDVYTITKKGKP